MPGQGFHSEWVTIKGHRILLECRTGFPDDTMHFIACIAVEMCDNYSPSTAKVVKLFHDEKSGSTDIKIATTNIGDKTIEEALSTVLNTLFEGNQYHVEVMVFDPGNEGSDSFDYTEYLSIQAGVCPGYD